MPRRRVFGGEVTLPPGESAIVVAPLTGELRRVGQGPLPKPGEVIKRDQPIFELLPLLTPERYIPTIAEQAQIANANAVVMSLQITADGDVDQANEEVVAAKIALDRAEQLLRDRAGSARAVDDAKAVLAVAESRLKAARDRQGMLRKLANEKGPTAGEPIPITSPIQGVLRTLPAAAGQTVSAGSTLFEVINLDSLWIRVPVYVGQLDTLDLTAEAAINLPGKTTSARMLSAKPIPAPPTADPLASTVDLFYSLAETVNPLQPGERVLAELQLTDEGESLVVPAKAVLRDIYGGTWVYVTEDKEHFHRERVVLKYFNDSEAILDGGPAEGTEVVVDGAAEIFGTEFGTGK